MDMRPRLCPEPIPDEASEGYFLDVDRYIAITDHLFIKERILIHDFFQLRTIESRCVIDIALRGLRLGEDQIQMLALHDVEIIVVCSYSRVIAGERPFVKPPHSIAQPRRIPLHYRNIAAPRKVDEPHRSIIINSSI